MVFRDLRVRPAALLCATALGLAACVGAHDMDPDSAQPTAQPTEVLADIDLGRDGRIQYVASSDSDDILALGGFAQTLSPETATKLADLDLTDMAGTYTKLAQHPQPEVLEHLKQRQGTAVAAAKAKSSTLIRLLKDPARAGAQEAVDDFFGQFCSAKNGDGFTSACNVALYPPAVDQTVVRNPLKSKADSGLVPTSVGSMGMTQITPGFFRNTTSAWVLHADLASPTKSFTFPMAPDQRGVVTRVAGTGTVRYYGSDIAVLPAGVGNGVLFQLAALTPGRPGD